MNVFGVVSMNDGGLMELPIIYTIIGYYFNQEALNVKTWVEGTTVKHTAIVGEVSSFFDDRVASMYKDVFTVIVWGNVYSNLVRSGESRKIRKVEMSVNNRSFTLSVELTDKNTALALRDNIGDRVNEFVDILGRLYGYASIKVIEFFVNEMKWALMGDLGYMVDEESSRGDT